MSRNALTAFLALEGEGGTACCLSRLSRRSRRQDLRAGDAPVLASAASRAVLTAALRRAVRKRQAYPPVIRQLT